MMLSWQLNWRRWARSWPSWPPRNAVGTCGGHRSSDTTKDSIWLQIRIDKIVLDSNWRQLLWWATLELLFLEYRRWTISEWYLTVVMQTLFKSLILTESLHINFSIVDIYRFQSDRNNMALSVESTKQYVIER